MKHELWPNRPLAAKLNDRTAFVCSRSHRGGDTQLPAAKRGRELRGSKILVYIGAPVQLSRFGKRRGWGGRREESEKKADSTIRPITVLSPWFATLLRSLLVDGYLARCRLTLGYESGVR